MPHKWVPQWGPHRYIVPHTDAKVVVVEVELKVAASQGCGLARCGVDVRGVLLWQASHWVPRHAQRLIVLSDIACGVPVLNLHALQKSVRADSNSGVRRRTCTSSPSTGNMLRVCSVLCIVQGSHMAR